MVDHRLGDLVAPECRLSCLPRVVLMGGEEAGLAYPFSNFFILIQMKPPLSQLISARRPAWSRDLLSYLRCRDNNILLGIKKKKKDESPAQPRLCGTMVGGNHAH